MAPDTRIDLAEAVDELRPAVAELRYLSGFGNELASEAVPGVLPQGQNAPQAPPRGLYTEQLSGTPFTAPRAENRRSWLYRIRPSAMHRPFRRIVDGLLRTAPCGEAERRQIGCAGTLRPIRNGRPISSMASRWMVAEHTFRPPFFHRNYMSEFMGLVRGAYDAKAGGFVPGGMSLHNCMSAHGPDRATLERAIAADLQPNKITDTLAFMFETRLAVRPTRFALETPALQQNYDACWAGFERLFDG